MIIGFSRHSKGPAGRAIEYLLRPTDPRTNELREKQPEVLRGDPEAIQELTLSLSFEHTYTSGVLSFAPGEVITPQMEQDIMDRFEGAAFAGLDADQYSILWVRHEHAGHHEMHFFTPRVELSTGKSLNIAPPRESTRELFDALRSNINYEYGLADPDDPERTREVSLPDHVAKLHAAALRKGERSKDLDPREIINDAIGKQIEIGAITSRDDVVSYLKDSGFEITRAGKEYITVSIPESGERFRMRGAFYEQNFRSVESLTREVTRGDERVHDRSEERIRELQETVIRLSERRALYNEKRYGERDTELERQRERGDRELSYGVERGAPEIPLLTHEIKISMADLCRGTCFNRSSFLSVAVDRDVQKGVRDTHERAISDERGIEYRAAELSRGTESRDISQDRGRSDSEGREVLSRYGWEYIRDNFNAVKEKIKEGYDRIRETFSRFHDSFNHGIRHERERFDEKVRDVDRSLGHLERTNEDTHKKLRDISGGLQKDSERLRKSLERGLSLVYALDRKYFEKDRERGSERTRER